MAPKAKKTKRPRSRKPRGGEKVSAPKPIEINITAAKGRPMLHWVGKRPLSRVRFFPAQHIESFDPSLTDGGGKSARAQESDIWHEWPSMYPKDGLLFHGDNKEVLGHLLASGFRNKVNLVYIDPPFDSGADYVRKVSLRGSEGSAKVEGETYTLGEQIQYTDIWANDNYLQFMYERLLLLKELLAEDGHLAVQADDKRGHYIKLLLDEVMGVDNYINDIVWHKGREGGGGTEVNPPLPTEYQNIYLYAKGRKIRKWNAPRGPYRLSTLAHLEKDERGWFYTRGRMGRQPKPWEIEAGVSKKTYVSDDPNEPLEELKKRLTSPSAEYVLIGDVWSQDLIRNSTETGYPTEKPKELLQRIIRAASNPGDIVLDCFIGSGTTAAVAQRLGRRWIGCDINKGAIQTTSRRLQAIVKEQIAAGTGKLPGIEDKEPQPFPAQTSFSVWRVNDYDLAIQHNEAVNLACEKIGVERKRTDAFFDGTLGKSLVKIVPFGHPLTPLDLEEIKRELEARPDEDRPVTVVTLGTELAAIAWIEEWNRLRKGKDGVNRITVVDLRTDPTHGGFIRHEPARAKVKIARKNGKAHIAIEDFISPTIIERLREQAGILKPKISDWRSMVDCVMIDSRYDGKIFNIALSDVPERKADLVTGKYELPAPAGETMVAVKIIDMLGEEALVTQKV